MTKKPDWEEEFDKVFHSPLGCVMKDKYVDGRTKLLTSDEKMKPFITNLLKEKEIETLEGVVEDLEWHGTFSKDSYKAVFNSKIKSLKGE